MQKCGFPLLKENTFFNKYYYQGISYTQCLKQPHANMQTKFCKYFPDEHKRATNVPTVTANAGWGSLLHNTQQCEWSQPSEYSARRTLHTYSPVGCNKIHTPSCLNSKTNCTRLGSISRLESNRWKDTSGWKERLSTGSSLQNNLYGCRFCPPCKGQTGYNDSGEN